jgi:hypothetical protein
MTEQAKSYWQVVEPIFSMVDTTDEAAFLKSTKLLARPIVLLCASHLCLVEIHNGGLLQFFWNSAGLIGPEIVEGFGLIGMPKLSALLTEVSAPLGVPYPRDRDDRWDALLRASGKDGRELQSMFKYLGFVAATQSLSIRDKEAWNLATRESGGFGEAATRYCETRGLL